MDEEKKTVVELLTIASMAVKINKEAGESQPFPLVEAAELAREIAEDALKRAKALLAQDGQE